MKTFGQTGETLTLTAPRALTSGQGALVGAVVGFCVTDLGSGVVGEFFVGPGVITHAKPGSQAWTVGARVYWDNTAFNVTTTVGSNTLIGVAAAAVGAGAGETTGTIRLNGTF